MHEKVEVRQLEEGLGGSWHPGIVVGVSESCRKVRYDDLLSDTGKSKLIESIPVTGAIEGLYQRPFVKSNYRGRIRPRPPSPEHFDVKTSLSFGVCVDVLFKEAWWEGVIFDYNEGGEERCVFFPDEGDERKFKLTDIRVTLEWDEFSGNWRERGVWTLVCLAKEHKKEGHIFQLVKRIWSRLKVHYGFMKMISEWTFGAYCLWKEYFREIVCDITSRPRLKGLASRVNAVRKRGHRSKRSQGSHLKATVLTRSMHRRKERESLVVRTRRMCMSDAEDSTNLPDGQRRRSQLVVSHVCINSHISNTGEDDKRGQIRESVVVKDGYQTDSVLTRNLATLENSTRISQNSHFRRKWQMVENKLTPRKLKRSKIYGHKLDRYATSGSKVIKKVGDHASLQVQDCQSVDKMKELMLRRQKKGGLNVRSILRRQRRVTFSARSIQKKRSPLRIKKMAPRKTEKGGISKSKPALQEEAEASMALHKQDDPFGNHCEGSRPGTTSCQESQPEDTVNSSLKQKGKKSRCRDSVCFVCQYGGELIHCDHCMSSYHLTCIDLKEVAVGQSFCPCCRCGLCGLASSASDNKLFTHVCYQCSRQYHVDCLNKGGSISEDSCLDKFCSKSCFEICAHLHELMQISNPTIMEGLTWTITRSRRNDCNVHSDRFHPLVQVSQVLNVLHECFEPITEPHTGRDLVSDIVYNSGSKFRRLDFHGFYVMALLNGEELVCVATIRIHGQKVAEMPLIATRFKYRRQGMCRLLVSELEKMLVEMGVEMLVLPGIAQLSDTWVSAFGFSEMPAALRTEFSAYPFVVFQGTTMFHKSLSRTDSSSQSSQAHAGNIGSPSQEKDQAQGPDRRFSLRYKRKQKPKTCGKEKVVTDGSDGNQPAYKFVYKRRRIQASRDSLDST